MRRGVFYTIGLCIMLLANSCILDDNDMSECFFGLRLKFVSTLYDAEGEPDCIPDIQSVKVFVFNEDDLLCAISHAEGDCLASDHTLDVALLPGTYKVMVWGSSSSDFSRCYEQAEIREKQNEHELLPVEVGVTSLSDFLMLLKCNADSQSDGGWLPSVADFDDVYYGMVGKRATATSIYSIEEVVIPKHKVVERQVDLMRNTNRLKVSIIDAQNLMINQDKIEVYAQGFNRGYGFDNHRNEKTGEIKYMSQSLPGTDQIWRFDVRTQRIERDTYSDKPLMLYLYNNQKQQGICKLNVVEILLDVKDNNGNYLYKNQEMLDRKYTHLIELKVEGDGDRVVVRVFVNGWEIKNIYPAN